jgi:hypothetical protein
VTARALAATTQSCDVCRTTWGQFVSAGGTTLCLGCHVERELDPLTLAEPASSGEENHTQDKAQAKDQGKSQVQTLTSSKPPEPGCGFDDDGPELRRLMAAYREGRLEPVDVQLGGLPPHAGAVMRGVARTAVEHLSGTDSATSASSPLARPRRGIDGAGPENAESPPWRASKAMGAAGFEPATSRV